MFTCRSCGSEKHTQDTCPHRLLSEDRRPDGSNDWDGIPADIELITPSMA